MGLKKKLTKLEEAPEPLRALYEKQTDGTFMLALDDDEPPDTGDSGAKDRAKLKEMRDTNIALQKQLKEQADKLASIDMEKYEQGGRMLDQVKDEQQRKDFASGKLTLREMVNQQLDIVRKTHEDAQKKLAADLEAAKAASVKGLSRLARREIGEAARKAAQKAGIKILPTAEDDFTDYAVKFGRLNPETLDPELMDGDEPRLDKSGKPMTWESLAAQALEERTHYFESGAGGGAKGGTTGRPAGKQRVEMVGGTFSADADTRKAITEGRAVVG